ncbi:hypothetical protein [Streptomyces sp. JNUCC 63]
MDSHRSPEHYGRTFRLEGEIAVCRKVIDLMEEAMLPKRRCEMIFAVAEAGFPVRGVIELLGVSQSGYYAWLTRKTARPRAAPCRQTTTTGSTRNNPRNTCGTFSSARPADSETRKRKPPAPTDRTPAPRHPRPTSVSGFPGLQQ